MILNIAHTIKPVKIKIIIIIPKSSPIAPIVLFSSRANPINPKTIASIPNINGATKNPSIPKINEKIPKILLANFLTSEF